MFRERKNRLAMYHLLVPAYQQLVRAIRRFGYDEGKAIHLLEFQCKRALIWIGICGGIIGTQEVVKHASQTLKEIYPLIAIPVILAGVASLLDTLGVVFIMYDENRK